MVRLWGSGRCDCARNVQLDDVSRLGVTLFRTSAGWPVAFQVGRDAKQELAQPFLFAPAKLHERSNNSTWPSEENFTSCIEIIFL